MLSMFNNKSYLRVHTYNYVRSPAVIFSIDVTRCF